MCHAYTLSITQFLFIIVFYHFSLKAVPFPNMTKGPFLPSMCRCTPHILFTPPPPSSLAFRYSLPHFISVSFHNCFLLSSCHFLLLQAPVRIYHRKFMLFYLSCGTTECSYFRFVSFRRAISPIKSMTN